ncbi:MAG: glycoside hydrolase family 35 protein [Actinomycetota bacterium]
MTTFSIGETDFLRDGQPHRILSGAIHYFRVHPDLWRDRVRKARSLGLNTIETYVAWNAHEPRRGEWDATGWNDLGRFLDIIAEEGMDAIVRPGPYICAEWHNGGLPVWLTGTPGTVLRSSDPQYLEAVTGYLRRVYEIVRPRQIDGGGPVVLVQIENEYGAYGTDTAYLEALVEVTRDAGITVPLTSVDQPTDDMLAAGTLPDLLTTGSFGSRSVERLETLRRHQPTGPLMCSEFWDGWFDWWGGVHHRTDPSQAAAELDALLATGASVNLYMFHGGTNFALTNGANDKGRYLPITTSYDYDAPLDEAGELTEKFFAFREVIGKYAPLPDLEPAPADPSPERTVDVRSVGAWTTVDALDRTWAEPPSFDELGHASALIRYDVSLPAAFADPARAHTLVFGEVRDQAWVSVDGRPVGDISRTRGERSLRIPGGTRLTVLVEEQGRVNYDHRLGEPKGLIGSATLDDTPLEGWSAAPIDVVAAGTHAGSLPAAHGAEPEAWEGTFELDAPATLFLDTAGWGRGYAFVNGFFLGRYGRTGPQRTLVVPAPETRAGTNRVTMLELEHPLTPRIEFVASPLLGSSEE